MVTLGKIKESLARKCITRVGNVEQSRQRVFSDGANGTSRRGIEIDVLECIFELIVLSGLFQPGA